MNELADHLQLTLSGGLEPPDANCWQKLAPIVEIAPTSGLEAAIVARTAEIMARREREIIAQVFAKTRTLRFTHLLPHLLKPETGLPIVTTNYDRLLEIAAEEAGLGVDTMFVGDFAGTINESESRLSFCREVISKEDKSNIGHG